MEKKRKSMVNKGLENFLSLTMFFDSTAVIVLNGLNDG